ncbi:unnamed protein product [Rotaria sp. Silwood2]|nr:unnamed protein product [Rotaria sp. Silwood2]
MSGPTPHSHASNPERIPAVEIKNDIKIKAAISNEAPSSIIQSSLRSLPLTAVSSLPSSDSLARTVRRQRPTLSLTSSSQLPIELRKTDRGDDFILYEDNEMIIFTTKRNLYLLKECTHWFVDGTFKVCPKQFYQLFTLHALLKSVVIPLVYGLLIGCLFHYGQCIWRHIQENGLSTKYDDDDNFRLNVRKLLSLPFVPASEVIEAFELIADEFDDEADTLVEYYEKTWIGEKKKRGAGRKKPKFNNELWNVCDVHNRQDDLIDHVKDDRARQRRYDIDEPLSFNVFHHDTNNDKSTMELNGEFLQTQLLIDCLDRMKVTDTDKINLLPYQFDGTQKIHFFYRVLNKALRIQDTNLLLLFRFFIRDIEKQLREYQCPSPVTLYRANDFIASNTTDENLKRILFEIYADPSQNQSKPFADISSVSCISDEQEVLMMIGSVFRIDGVDDTIECIRMTLCNHNDQNFNLLFDFMQKKNCIATARLTNFGSVLIGMDKFDVAERHFKCLLRTFSPNHPDLLICYQALEKIYCEKCDFDRSLKYFKIGLNILYRESNSNQIEIEYFHNSIGEVYQKKGETKEALKSFQQALKIFSEIPVI